MRWNSRQLAVAACAGLFIPPACGQRPLAWQTISALDGTPIREAGPPTASQPYLGLVLQDHKLETGEARCLVYVVRPGPVREALALQGREYPSLILLTVNDRQIHSIADFRHVMLGLSVGAEVRLRFLQTAPKPDTIRTVTVRVASREDWAAPIDYARPPRVPIAPEEVVAAGAELTRFERFIEGQMERHGLSAPVAETRKHLVRSMESNYAPNMLNRVAYGFYRPSRLAELQSAITDPLVRIVEQRKGARLDVLGPILAEAAKNLDAPFAPSESARLDIGNPRQCLRDAAVMIRLAHTHRNQAFERVDAGRRKDVESSAVRLLDPERWADRSVVRARQATLAVDYPSLLAAAGAAVAWSVPGDPPARDSLQPASIPSELKDAVKGDVLAAERIDGRWYIYGGFGSNEYDMTRIDAVVDPGGDDLYRYRQPGDQRPRVQLVVDWAGADRYIGDPGAPGPAGGFLGVSVIWDREGDDHYEGGELSCGAGLMGVGLILDLDGNDSYRGTSWSLGAAKYGFGAIIDLGRGADTYISHVFSQGTGGPRGLGLLLDEAGNDLYRANGPVSAGFAGIYLGQSQGFGTTDFSTAFGGFDAGGIGVLSDLGGNDRYEVGRFGQGMGFFYGLGLLYDRRGRDLYYGTNYSQGSSAHGGVGILADDAGDDTYYGSIALAHDAGVALLIDRDGNDSYQGEFVSPGVARGVNQAIAWLVDLDGQDRYNIPESRMRSVSASSTENEHAAAASDAAGIGQSGSNTFSYTDCKCSSLSVLVDAGGTPDLYSRKDRGDGVMISTDKPNPWMPKYGNLHGLFIDTARRMTFWP